MLADEYAQRMVYVECIGESFLSAGVMRRCGEATFSVHYYRTSEEADAFEQAMQADRELDYEFDRHGQDVLLAIAGAAEVSKEIAQEVLNILEDRHNDFDADAGGECEFDSESLYERRDTNDVEYQLGGDPLVRLEARDKLVMPATLRVTYCDGHTADVRLPAETWIRQGSVAVLVPPGDVRAAELDPDHVLPDRDRINNRTVAQ